MKAMKQNKGWRPLGRLFASSVQDLFFTDIVIIHIYTTHTYVYTYKQTHTLSPQGMQMTLSAEPTQKLGAFERTFYARKHTFCE
jgi:hypothetical protein